MANPTYILGADEAGYGPNLGPLVVATTLWRIDDATESQATDPFEGLFRRADEPIDERPLVDDSKKVYTRGGLAELAAATLAARLPDCECAKCVELDCNSRRRANTEDTSALSVRKYWRSLVRSGDVDGWDELFWLKDAADRMPSDDDATIENAPFPASRRPQKCRRERLYSPSVALVDAQAAALFPESFNRGVERAGNKATLLTETTLALAADTIRDLPYSANVRLAFDRQGGRKKYAAVLQNAFPDALVMTVEESARVSRYRWRRGESAVECEFRVGGDSYAPTALASMTAKYLRELAMRAWNDYWIAKKPGLRPTAGYPVDAKRFLADIRDLLAADGIPEETIWRCR